MSRNILAAIRTQKQLRGNRFLVALELAALMNEHGRKRVAYAYLAHKAHCSRRTAMRAMQDLVAWGIYSCEPQQGPGGDEINLFICRIPPPPGFRAIPATARSDKVSPTLPKTTQGEEAGPSLREKIATLTKGLRIYSSTTSEGYLSTQEEITRLTTYLKESL